ncbi:MAG: hypothetical protein ACRDS0_36800 [Pseudonocardiaceae bacterium]
MAAGAQTTQTLFNQLCNTILTSPSRVCQSWDNAPQNGPITTRNPAVTPGCNNIRRPRDGGDGVDQLIALPACYDIARVVTDADKLTRPAGFTYIPFATDTLTYAFLNAPNGVPPNLSDATLKRIYTCDPAITFPSNLAGFKPLIGNYLAGNRTFLFNKLGITDAPDYTTTHPCVRDKDNQGNGILANDARYLSDPKELITYSAGPYIAQILKAVPDIHNNSVLGSINGTPPILDPDSFGARPVFSVVRTADITGPTARPEMVTLLVGPNSQVCQNTAAIRKNGFDLRSNCGDISEHSGP